MRDCECPYCHKDMEEPDECYDQDRIYEHECPHCEKAFVFTVSYIKCYHTDTADCLNGKDHDYQPTRTYPVEFTKLECSMCGDEKSMPEDQLQQLIARKEAQ